MPRLRKQRLYGAGAIMSGFTESIVDTAALTWLEGRGYAVHHCPENTADMPGAERSDQNHRELVLPKFIASGLRTKTFVLVS